MLPCPTCPGVVVDPRCADDVLIPDEVLNELLSDRTNRVSVVSDDLEQRGKKDASCMYQDVLHLHISLPPLEEAMQ